MTTNKTIAAVLLMAGTFVFSTPARVFWSRPAAKGLAVLETTTNWKTIYRSSVRINEGRGELTVTGCDEPLSSVMARLRQAYPPGGTPVVFRQTDTMGWAQISEDQAIVTMLALAPAAQDHSIIFVLTQAKGDFEKSRVPPAASRLRDPPPYPGCRVQTYLTSEESRMQLEVYNAAAMPEAVQQYYESALLGQAWTRLDPGNNAASLVLYQKGAVLCAVLVLPSDEGAASTITVLHKQLNME